MPAFNQIGLSVWMTLFCFSLPASAQYGGLPGANPTDPRLQGYNWGIEQEDLGGYDQATIKRAYKKGLALLQEGKCKKATAKFETVLKALPQNASALYLAGSASRCERKFRAAAALYERAIRQDDSLFVAYKNLGVSYLAMSDFDSALAPLAELEVKRVECQNVCPAELESAYADLKRFIELAKAQPAPSE